MRSLLRDLLSHRELLWILVQRNLKIRYKNSVLGFFWTLLGPIFLILIYWAFIRLLKIEISINALITGIIVWQFVAMSLGDSLNSILGNASLVTKTAFPRFLLPLATVSANFINYLLTFIVLLVFLLARNAEPGAVYILPLILLTQFALCLGLGFLVSGLNVFFRDVEHLMNVLLLAWFFLSPVMYTNTYVTNQLAGQVIPTNPYVTDTSVGEMMHTNTYLTDQIAGEMMHTNMYVTDPLPGPGRFSESTAELLHACYLANPIAGIVTSYRYVLLQEDMLPLAWFVAPFVLSWGILFGGLAVFRKLERRFGDEL
jgi:ABC-type polysaccharide/polyol phosphate export permease